MFDITLTEEEKKILLTLSADSVEFNNLIKSIQYIIQGLHTVDVQIRQSETPLISQSNENLINLHTALTKYLYGDMPEPRKMFYSEEIVDPATAETTKAPDTQAQSADIPGLKETCRAAAYAAYNEAMTHIEDHGPDAESNTDNSQPVGGFVDQPVAPEQPQEPVLMTWQEVEDTHTAEPVHSAEDIDKALVMKPSNVPETPTHDFQATEKMPDEAWVRVLSMLELKQSATHSHRFGKDFEAAEDWEHINDNKHAFVIDSKNRCIIRKNKSGKTHVVGGVRVIHPKGVLKAYQAIARVVEGEHDVSDKRLARCVEFHVFTELKVASLLLEKTIDEKIICSLDETGTKFRAAKMGIMREIDLLKFPESQRNVFLQAADKAKQRYIACTITA